MYPYVSIFLISKIISASIFFRGIHPTENSMTYTSQHWRYQQPGVVPPPESLQIESKLHSVLPPAQVGYMGNGMSRDMLGTHLFVVVDIFIYYTIIHIK